MALRPVSSKKYSFPYRRPTVFEEVAPVETTEYAAAKNNTMGLVYAKVELINSRDLWRAEEGIIQEDQIRQMKVEFLVDTGAYMLTINNTIREQLGLPTLETRPAELANGDVIQCEVVGPIELRYANRRSTQCAMVLPGDSEPLFGAIPMEDMDLVVEPRTQRLLLNPEHPLAPQMSLK